MKCTYCNNKVLEMFRIKNNVYCSINCFGDEDKKIKPKKAKKKVSLGKRIIKGLKEVIKSEKRRSKAA